MSRGRGPPGSSRSLGRGAGHLARGDRDAETVEQFFGLVFVQIHGARLSGEGAYCGRISRTVKPQRGAPGRDLDTGQAAGEVGKASRFQAGGQT